MARVVIVGSGLVGRLTVFIEATRRLTARGHEVTLLSTRDTDDLPREVTGAYVSLPSTDGVGSETSKAPGGGRRAAALLKRLAGARDTAQRREKRVDILNPEGLVEMFNRLEPDLILVDIELPVEIMAAHATGLPMVLLSDMYSLWHQPGVPPLSSDIVPGRGWRGTDWAIEVAWLRFRIWKGLARFRSRITRVGLDRRSVLRRVAERTGFPFDDETATGHWLIPFVYESIPTLVLNAMEMEFPHEPSSHISYVGPQIGAPTTRGKVRPHPLRGHELDDVLERRRVEETEALIYCSFGAVASTDRSILQRVVDAVGDQPGWELVVGLGGRVQTGAFPSLPDNVHIYQWAPQLEILSAADCAIHHGGTHSINESVYSEVPMLVFPDDELDHKGNAARVAFHGLGLVGDISSDDADTIRRHIVHCLAGDEIRSRLSAMAAVFRSYEERKVLEDAVDALLET